MEWDVLFPLIQNQGLQIFWQTLGYGAIISLASTLFGFTWGWICARYDFPGRRWIMWLLPAPIAVPVYIYAFIYLSLWQEFVSYEKPHWLFLMLFCFSTYPYAFLLSTVAFQKKPKSLEEYTRILGFQRKQFWKILQWPLTKPLFFSSCLVIGFEYFSDFGASQIFGVQTLSTVIYKVWNAYYSLPTASLLAFLLMMVVFGLLFLDSRRQEYSFPSEPVQREMAPHPQLIFIAGLITVTFAFLIPFASLVYLGIQEISTFKNHDALWKALQNSLLLSLTFSFSVVIAMSLLIFLFKRNDPRLRWLRLFTQFGYAVPGTALAVAVTIPFFYLQRYLDGFSRSTLTALFLMFLAWLIRFFKVGWDSIDKSRFQFAESLEEIGQLYESRPLFRWFRFQLPMVSSAMGVSFLLLFLETMKELPVVLLTRPFGWDTLSVKFFEFSSESDWAKAAPYGLLIVIFGMLGNLILVRKDPPSC